MNCKKWLLICFWFLCLPVAAQNFLTESTDIEETLYDFTSAINNLYDNPSKLNDAISSTGKHFGHSEYFYYNGELISSFTKWLNTYNRIVLKGRYIEHTLEVQSKTFEKVNPSKKEDKTFKVNAKLLREDEQGNIYSDDVTFTILWKGYGQHDKITKIEGNWIRELTPEMRKVQSQPTETTSKTTEVTNTSTDDEKDDGWAWWQILLAVLIGIPVLLFLIGFLKAVYDAINEKQTAVKNKEENTSNIHDAEVQTSKQRHVVEPRDSTPANSNRDNSDTSSVKSKKESVKPKTEQKQQVHSQPAPTIQEDAETLYEQGIKYLQGNGIKKDAKQAFELFTKSHELGYPNATYMLGCCYYQGLGTFENKELALQFFHKAVETEQVPFAAYYLGICYEDKLQYQKAFNWFKKAVDVGYTEAHLKLGRYYETGLGGWKNEEKAFQHYSDAGYHGYAEAEFHLGRCHYEGIGTAMNLNEALNYWRSAERKGNTEAVYRLALHYSQAAEKSNDFRSISVFLKKAAGYFKKAAGEGHVESMYRLAECYYTGQGLPQDYAPAYHWYVLAAENGNTDAMYKQALLLYNGQKDIQKAVSIWKKAADLGHTESMYSLAKHYADDRSNPYNIRKALEYYSKADEAGHEGAKTALQQLRQELNKVSTTKTENQSANQESGTSTKPVKDSPIKSPAPQAVEAERNKMLYNRAMADYNAKKYDEAFRQFHHLARVGFEHAEYMTGLCYAKGQGTSLDLKQAAEFMRKAADKNHTEAQFQYGMMLYQCKELAINKLNASNYFRKAAIKQHPEAMYMLAQCYEYGNKGAEKNYKEAAKWYEKAMKKGWAPAKDALMRVKDRMH